MKNLPFFRRIDEIIWFLLRQLSLNLLLDRVAYKYLICDLIITSYDNKPLLGRNYLSCFLEKNLLWLKIAKDLQHKNACLT